MATSLEEFDEENVKKNYRECTKLTSDPNHHSYFLNVEDVLNKKKDLKIDSYDADMQELIRIFFNSKDALEFLSLISKNVVRIKKKGESGTGCYVKYDGEDFILTNAHVVRMGADRNLEYHHQFPEDVSVEFIGRENVIVTVEEFLEYSGNMKSKMENKKEETDKEIKEGKSKNVNPTSMNIEKLEKANNLLLPLYENSNASMDYIKIKVSLNESNDECASQKCNENTNSKVSVDESNDQKCNANTNSKFQPLQIDKFKLPYGNYRNTETLDGLRHPSASSFPKSIGLFAVSHPHGCQKQKITFGKLNSSINRLHFLNGARGQNDAASSDPFVKHSVPTCKGSSGAPIFYFVVDHQNRTVDVERSVQFLHFGDQNAVLGGTLITRFYMDKYMSNFKDALHEAAKYS